ncbi:MAG TPA: hypothetical protein VJU16_04060, partial [Planctomycetota bacterium]|nr:hypothetical protein [Planctomycetota bacterium]
GTTSITWRRWSACGRPMAVDHLAAVESLAGDLEQAGFEPVLVGGMALVILGSQRVTKDFDFLVAAPETAMPDLVRIMDRHRLRRMKAGDSRSRVLRFCNQKTRFRVGLLLDHPLPARSVALRAAKVRLKARRIAVASPEDLLRLKEIAHSERQSASEAQDLEFLRKHLKKN